MVLVNLDDTLYANLKLFLKDNTIEYPNLKNFVDRAVKNQLRIDTLRNKEQKVK